MANRLKMALIDTIERLRRQGWSQRRIARELQIDRETVARYLGLSEAPKPATSEGALSDSKPATLAEALSAAPPAASAADLNDCSSCTTGGLETISATSSPTSPVVSAASAGSAASQCAPYHEQIVAKLEQGLSAQRIWQDLVSEHGFGHRYHSVRRTACGVM